VIAVVALDDFEVEDAASDEVLDKVADFFFGT
jgi:hypothetical protein